MLFDAESPLESLHVGGYPLTLKGGTDGDMVVYVGLPADGIEFTLVLDSAAALRMQVVDRTYELPDVRPSGYRERPPHIMPGRPDSTLVSREFTF